MTCFGEEGRGQGVLRAPAISQIPSASDIQYASVPYLEVVYSQPCQLRKERQAEDTFRVLPPHICPDVAHLHQLVPLRVGDPLPCLLPNYLTPAIESLWPSPVLGVGEAAGAPLSL